MSLLVVIQGGSGSGTALTAYVLLTLLDHNVKGSDQKKVSVMKIHRSPIPATTTIETDIFRQSI